MHQRTNSTISQPQRTDTAPTWTYWIWTKSVNARRSYWWFDKKFCLPWLTMVLRGEWVKLRQISRT